MQQNCLVCHQEGQTADQQGARLLFTDDAPANHLLVEAFVTTDGIGAEWLLGKIVGDFNHGGGAASDFSGRSVSLSSDGTRVAIGAYLNDGNGDDSGHVRVYSLPSSSSSSGASSGSGARPVPSLPFFGLLLLSGLLGVFGLHTLTENISKNG